MLAEQDTAPVAVGKAFELKVLVTDRAISLYSKRRKFLHAIREPGSFGGFGLNKTYFKEIVIEGQAHPSWIQGKIDAWVQEKRAVFDKTFDPKANGMVVPK